MFSIKSLETAQIRREKVYLMSLLSFLLYLRLNISITELLSLSQRDQVPVPIVVPPFPILRLFLLSSLKSIGIEEFSSCKLLQITDPPASIASIASQLQLAHKEHRAICVTVFQSYHEFLPPLLPASLLCCIIALSA
jgi:hypothetical protein